MPNYGYHFARLQGNVAEAIYDALLPLIVRRTIKCQRSIPIDVYSYSGQRRLAEQVASIRSFLKWAGRPNRFVVVSDGTYSAEAERLLRAVDCCVSLEQVPAGPANASPALADYLSTHPTGKQLALLSTLPRERPSFYVDSDVLFFAAAHELGQFFSEATAPAYYLEDCGFAGDDRFLRSAGEKAGPVNIGALLFLRPLDWSLAFQRFGELNGEPNFFTGQTMTHLIMHANCGKPFDPSKYVVALDDQFVYPDRYAGPNLVLRHYVNPVRHKFWTSLAR